MSGKLISILVLVGLLLVGVSAPQAQAAEPFVIGVIHISPVSDGGWTTAHDEGLRVALAEFGEVQGQLDGEWQAVDDLPNQLMPYRVLKDGATIIEVYVIEAVAPDAYFASAETLINDFGSNLVIGTAENYCADADILAEDYPETYFATIHCSYDGQAENVVSYFGQSFSATYIAGAALAQLSKTGVACFVGAFADNGQVAANLAGFVRGFDEYYEGEAEVTALFTGTWFDPSLEVQAAESCPENADVGAIHQDSPSAITVFAENGMWSMGYDSDQSSFGATVSTVWHWQWIYSQLIGGALAGDYPYGRFWPVIGDGTDVVDLAWSEDAPASAVEFANELAAKLVAGDVVVFPHLTEEEVWNLSDWELAAYGDQ
jgi:basic membrane protein A